MKILTPDFERLDVETDATPSVLIVSDDAIQAIARLFAYDDIRKVWTPLKSLNGYVALSDSAAYATTFSVTPVGTSPLLIRNNNPNTRQIIVSNRGASACYISNNPSVLSTGSYLLYPGESVILARYIDNLYARSAGSSDIQYIDSVLL